MVRSTFLIALLSISGLSLGCCSMDPCSGAMHCRGPFCGHSFGFVGRRCGGCASQCGRCNKCRSCSPCQGACATGYTPGDPTLVAPAYGPPAVHVPGAVTTPPSVQTMPTLNAPAAAPAATTTPTLLPAAPHHGVASPLVPPPQALPTGVSPRPEARAPAAIRNTYSWRRTPQRS